MRINAFPYVKINDKKLEECKGKFQKLLYNFQVRFIDLQNLFSKTRLKNVVNSVYPIFEPLVSDVPAVEKEQLVLQEDLA